MSRIGSILNELRNQWELEHGEKLRAPFTFPIGVTHLDQYVIPRYPDGKNHPAGGLRGYGPGSALRATNRTQTLPNKGLVVTEDFGKWLEMWQSNKPNTFAPILQPTIRDITLQGFDFRGDDWWNGAAVWDQPYYAGVLWNASGGLVDNVGIFGFPEAGKFTRTGRLEDKAGGLRPYDNEKFKLFNVNVGMCAKGVDIDVVDAVVGGLSGAHCKEYCFKFSRGATQIAGAIHSWGGERGIWFAQSAGGSEGGPFYCEQGPVALQIDSSSNTFHTIKAHSSTVACIVVNGQDNVLRGVRIPLVAATPCGLQINHQYNEVDGARIEVAAGGKGISLGGTHGGVGTQLRSLRMSGGDKNSVYIDCQSEHGLANAHIELHCGGSPSGATAVRINKLGGGCRIIVTTAGWPDAIGGLGKPLDIPETFPESTIVELNGVRVRGK